jgi:hypothetical protein
LTLYVNGTAYAVMTTVGASSNPNQATWVALNGASITPSTVTLGSYSNSATAVAFSLTLPTTVTIVTGAYIEFKNISPTGSSSIAGDDIGVAVDSILQCRKPIVKITKISNGGVNNFSFNNLTNLSNSVGTVVTTDNVTTVIAGTPATSTQLNYATANGTIVDINEAVVANYALSSASCIDENSAITGSTGSFGSLSGAKLTIPATNIKYAASINCTFTNTRKAVPLTLRKTWVNAKVNDTATITATGLTSLNSIANSANETDVAAAQIVYSGDVITIAESIGVGGTNYNAVLNCIGNTTPLSGNSLTINAADNTITCTYTNSLNSVVISGRVFDDNSGTTANPTNAYNGTQQAGESGIANSTIRLTDCGSTTVATTTTNASGDYSFSVPPAQVPTPTFCIVQSNVAGYESVSGTAGYARLTDTITVNNTGATSYVNHNFGDARLNLVLTERGQKTTIAGGVVDYPHRLIAHSVVTIDAFNTASNQQPANSNDQLWQSSIYKDANCNGKVDAGETLFSQGLPLTLLPTDNQCLVQRVQAPINASGGAQHLSELVASYKVVLAGNTELDNKTSNRTGDTTIIGSASLDMQKRVRVVATCPSTAADTNPFVVVNQATANSYLEYEITYRNNSTKNLVDIVVKDSIPKGTIYQSMQCSVNPMSSCTPTQQGESLIWQMTGTLLPAQEGKVRFCTRVP